MHDGQWRRPETSRAQEPKEGRPPKRFSPGNTGCGAWGKSGQSYKTKDLRRRTGLFSYPQKLLGVALSDEQECVPRHRLWVVCCACALFLPVAPSERAPFPCVLTRIRAAF